MKQIIHSLVAKDGKYIVMPPWKEGQEGWGNLAHPNVHLAGGNAVSKYPINTKFVDFDRSFIYGYQSGEYDTQAKANVGIHNSNRMETVTTGTVVAAAGATTVSVLANSLDVETAAVANIFAGGYFMPRVNPYGEYRIVSNTAFNGGSVGTTEMDIVIEADGLGVALAAGTASCYLDKNPYTALYKNFNGGNNAQSVVGVTLIDPVTSTYYWLQVSGPVHVPGDENMGASADIRSAWWHIDGSIRAGAGYTQGSTLQQQYAGWAIPDTLTGTFGMTWFLMMTPLG